MHLHESQGWQEAARCKDHQRRDGGEHRHATAETGCGDAEMGRWRACRGGLAWPRSGRTCGGRQGFVCRLRWRRWRRRGLRPPAAGGGGEAVRCGGLGRWRRRWRASEGPQGQRAQPGDRTLGLLSSVVRTSPALITCQWGRAERPEPGTRLLAFTLADP